jgi:hypothetical protein
VAHHRVRGVISEAILWMNGGAGRTAPQGDIQFLFLKLGTLIYRVATEKGDEWYN